MKKCTLCVDRIYNDNLPDEDQVPACVRTCPTNARHFGDLGDPQSDVSRLVAERGGVDLMPEQDTKPVNKYLPPRPRRKADETPMSLLAMAEEATPAGFWKWVDKALEKLGKLQCVLRGLLSFLPPYPALVLGWQHGSCLGLSTSPIRLS